MEKCKCTVAGCEKEPKHRNDGSCFPFCWEHRQIDAKPAKQETLPQRSAQEQIADIGTTFQMSIGQAHSAYYELLEIMRKERDAKDLPAVSAEAEFKAVWDAAMHLNNQYWKNDRTPNR